MSQTLETQHTETLGRIDLPAPGTWAIDPSHSAVAFVVRHLMVSKVRGGFSTFSGSVEIGPEPTLSSVEVVIDAASIDTRDEQRDAHLRTPDFLDVERSPHLTFTSTKVDGQGSEWRVAGDLTIHGVTRGVVLDVEYHGTTKDPWGGQRAGFSATTEIDREDFGLTWNAALETGGFVVGKKVKIEIEIEAVHQVPGAQAK